MGFLPSDEDGHSGVILGDSLIVQVDGAGHNRYETSEAYVFFVMRTMTTIRTIRIIRTYSNLM